MSDATYQIEPWNDVRDIITALAETHARECDVSNGHAPFDLDQKMFQTLADADVLQVVTARIDGDVVGYVANVINRHPQYDMLCSFPMGWFVMPGHRGLIGLHLLRHAEDGLVARGIRCLYESHMAEADVSAILRRAGYQPKEIHYVKWIDHA